MNSSTSGELKRGRIKLNPRGAPLSAYLMTGTLTGLSGNRILLMSRSKMRAVATYFVERSEWDERHRTHAAVGNRAGRRQRSQGSWRKHGGE